MTVEGRAFISIHLNKWTAQQPSQVWLGRKDLGTSQWGKGPIPTPQTPDSENKWFRHSLHWLTMAVSLGQ